MFWFPLESYPEVELLDHSFIFNFLRNLCSLFHSICTSYNPTNSARDFPFFHILTNTCYNLFDNNYSDKCEVILLNFDLYFTDDYVSVIHFLVDTKETERTLAFPVQGARPWQLQSSVLCANVSLRSLLFP